MAVVVEVGDVDAHPRHARVLYPPVGLVGKRPVAVVDVQDVVRRPVVRDVDVGPSIPVDIGHDDAEPVAGVAPYPRSPGCVPERTRLAVGAVVPIQLVVTAWRLPPHPGGVAGHATKEILWRVVEHEQVEASV